MWPGRQSGTGKKDLAGGDGARREPGGGASRAGGGTSDREASVPVKAVPLSGR